MLEEVRIFFFRRKWRNKNKHNSTIPMNRFPVSSVKVGKHTYGYISVYDAGGHYQCIIGNYCSLAKESVFLLQEEHPYKYISTFPFKVKILGYQSEALSKGNIIIKDDVWIGFRSMIMSGVTVEQGAIIAAGAVVTKDVPAYSIVAGVPARVIGYRFSKDLVELLKEIDFSLLSEDYCKEHISDFYREIEKEKDPYQYVIEKFSFLMRDKENRHNNLRKENLI